LKESEETGMEIRGRKASTRGQSTEEVKKKGEKQRASTGVEE